jgi:hypothetical protein
MEDLFKPDSMLVPGALKGIQTGIRIMSLMYRVPRGKISITVGENVSY